MGNYKNYVVRRRWSESGDSITVEEVFGAHDSMLDAIEERNSIPGASILIIAKSEPVPQIGSSYIC